jgi:hypothetical protein
MGKGELLGQRSIYGVLPWRAVLPKKRASSIMPFLSQVLGSHEMLSLPAGQVTTCRSQSTRNWALANPSPERACQLGSLATEPQW